MLRFFSKNHKFVPWQSTFSAMDKTEKQNYASPETQVVEMQHEGMVCTSDGTVQPRTNFEIITDNPFAG